MFTIITVSWSLRNKNMATVSHRVARHKIWPSDWLDTFHRVSKLLYLVTKNRGPCQNRVWKSQSHATIIFRTWLTTSRSIRLYFVENYKYHELRDFPIVRTHIKYLVLLRNRLWDLCVSFFLFFAELLLKCWYWRLYLKRNKLSV